MKRYSAFAIAKNALTYHQGWERAWAKPEPKKEYDKGLKCDGRGLYGGDSCGVFFQRLDRRGYVGPYSKRYVLWIWPTA